MKIRAPWKTTPSSRRRVTCGATPPTDGRVPQILDPAERAFWRASCTEEAGHDGSNWHTPHRATGLGRHGQGELTWHDDPQPTLPDPERGLER